MAHGNAPLTPEGRLRLVLRIDEGRPIAHVATEAGVSRQRLGEWYRRWQNEGEAGLMDRSSRPHRSPNITDPAIEELVEQIRRDTRKGPKRIPGYTYLHAAIDAHTRLAYVECHENERAVTAIAFLDRALVFFASHGIHDVKSVMTDNGSAYVSKAWATALRDLGIEHFRTRRHRPQTNGKVERFNQTMQEEWLRVTGYRSEDERRAALIPFLNDYNHDRPHSGIGNRPPVHRAPMPGPRLTAAPIVVPERPASGQLTLDLNPDA